MIKGVNRQMLEVSDTKSPYFERALLVIRADMHTVDEGVLRRAASELLANTDSCSHLRRGRRRLLGARIVWMFLSAGLGAIITILVQQL